MTTVPTSIPYEDERYKWDYDDCGVLCRYDKETEAWEVMEDQCIDCGHRPDDCDCEEEGSATLEVAVKCKNESGIAMEGGVCPPEMTKTDATFARQEELPPSTMNPTQTTMTTETCDGCECAILRAKCYYLHFPDGTEEWFCADCQSSLRSGYISKADHRGFGLEDRWGDEEDCEVCDCKVAAEDHVGCCRDGDCPKKIESMCRFCATWDDETEQWRCEDCGVEAEEEAFNSKYPNASCLRCSQTLTGATVVLCGGGGGACETWYCADCHKDGTHDCEVCKA
jgi:hypothetical protein